MSIDERNHDSKADEDIGPQVGSDNALVRRLRRHQSWYRASVLQRPCGVGPKAASTRLVGSMLTPAAGESGANFLTDAIAGVAQKRLDQSSGAVEPYRLKHNMLSSQPTCFNLFGPLVTDLDLATRLWRALLGDEVARVIRVEVEYAPQPAAEYLNDRTAFDAFVEYERPDGQLAFTGIETKFSEPFSRRVFDGPDYRRWMVAP